MKHVLFNLIAIASFGWSSSAEAVPITAEYDLIIRDCVIFDTGSPYVFADDCTGTLIVETDTTITYSTPDEFQTGTAILSLQSETYGVTGALFFNYLEEYFPDENGNLVPICLSYCFSTDYDPIDGLSFNWGAYRGLPYSSGGFSGGTGWFDFEDSFRVSGGPSFGMTATGSIVPSPVPLPASGTLFLVAGLAFATTRRASLPCSDSIAS